MRSGITLTLPVALMAAIAGPARAQDHPPGEQGSRNVHVLSHVPLGRLFTVGDIEAEQELSRPYVYVPRMQGTTRSTGFSIVSVKDPSKARLLFTWTMEKPELLRAYGGLQGKYFKLKGRYYYAQSFQILKGSPNEEVGAIVFDVTGLPDTTTIREVRRLRVPANPGGIHNLFTYKHSDGRVLLFTTSTGPFTSVWDLDRFVSGAEDQGFVARIPIPETTAPAAAAPRAGTQNTTGTYHDFYVGYDPATHQDKFYGAAWSAGYFVFDVTRPEEPKLITSITGVAGGASYHTFTPTPDGRYAVGEMEYVYSPLRIYDLKPGLSGEVKTISRPIGAWTSNWRNLPHNHEVRWPYVFVSGYEDGMHVFNMMDPTNPYTVGYYDTYDGPRKRGWGGVDRPEEGTGNANGAFGVEVRNADGMIFVSDMSTGLWVLKMDGFDGWNGHQWGMPNVSSVQDWDNGPEGAPKPQKVS
ncbi:MAG: hypothetical protein EXR93_08625 [Gemmatimonadetes bacterium]|nr:hypothetical protein [Gemmatimonadota bacterium]